MKKQLLTIVFAVLMLVGIPTAVGAIPYIEISEQEMISVELSFDGQNLYVNNANGLILSVYNVAGVKVMSTRVEGVARKFTLNLPKGCYIVKVGNVTRKISVK